MRRKLTALLLGGALLLGATGMVGTAEASTTAPTNQSTVINQLLARITTQCAARPTTPLCVQFNRLSTAQINRAVDQVNRAVQQGGGAEAIRARLTTARATVCANPNTVLARVPAQFKTQATQAVTRLCAR